MMVTIPQLSKVWPLTPKTYRHRTSHGLKVQPVVRIFGDDANGKKRPSKETPRSCNPRVGYRRLPSVTVGYVGYRRLPSVTGGYRWLLSATVGHGWLLFTFFGFLVPGSLQLYWSGFLMLHLKTVIRDLYFSRNKKMSATITKSQVAFLLTR